MAPRLKLDRPLDTGFRALLLERLQRGQEQLGRAGAGKLEEGVHEARKEFKAVRSLARLLRPVVRKRDYREINARVREAAASVSPLRDAHALSDAIARLAHAQRVGEAQRQALERAAAAAPQEATHESADLIARARDILSPLPELIGSLALPADREAYLAGLAHGYREARQALRHGFKTRVATDLHDGRKRAINWRYQLDALANVRRGVLKAEVEELKSLRRSLGAHNDLVMLETALSAAQGPWAEIERSDILVAGIERLRAGLVDAARATATPLFSEKPKRYVGRLETAWRAATGE